jgi:hypothetical protein
MVLVKVTKGRFRIYIGFKELGFKYDQGWTAAVVPKLIIIQNQRSV